MRNLILAIFLTSLTACGSTTGWELKFGVNPITQVNDHKQLGHLGEGVGR